MQWPDQLSCWPIPEGRALAAAHAQVSPAARECWPMPCHMGIIRGADQGLAAFSPPFTLLPHPAPVHTSVEQCWTGDLSPDEGMGEGGLRSSPVRKRVSDAASIWAIPVHEGCQFC